MDMKEFQHRGRVARMGLVLLCVFTLAAAPGCAADEGAPEAAVDWSVFLGRLDPVWERMSSPWWEAPYAGNGEMGVLLRLEGQRALRLDLGSSRVHDHRTQDVWNGVVPNSVEVHTRGRLPIGRFELRTAGTIDANRSTARIDLWNAEVRGELVTDRGTIAWRTLIHADDMAGLLEWTPDEGEAGAQIVFVPEAAVSSRGRPGSMAGWENNPPARVEEAGDAKLCVQDLVAGGQTATAWVEETAAGGERRLWWSIRHTQPGPGARAEAVQTLEDVRGGPSKPWIERHRAWWHAWYPKSFFSLSDPYWEAYYWFQIYKLGSATRGDRSLIDNCGPWYQPSVWSATWWNLNVQLSYSPVFTANRLDLAEAVTGHLARGKENLIRSVDPEYQHDSAGLARQTGPDLLGWAGQPGGRANMERGHDVGHETGNLLWTCHLLYRHWRTGGDEAMARETLFPILRRAVNYHRHFLRVGDDGRLHLPTTHSPEYGNAADANYDLSLLRWGCRTLIELDEELNLSDPLRDEWVRIVEELTPYPENETGFMIGAGVPYAQGHRHWSHLMMIYPLREITVEDGQADRMLRSLSHWHSHPGGLAGYSFTGGAAMSAALGDGARVEHYLTGFKRFIEPGTLYREGGHLPVMETPLHAASALQDTVLQSYEGKLFVFRAVPPSWPEARFHRFLAEDGWEVSGVWSGGAPQWVAIRAGRAGRQTLFVPWQGAVRVETGGGGTCEPLADGAYLLELPAGAWARLVAGDGTDQPLVVEPVSGEPAHVFGLKTR
jgi:alpha-L-fucosidase 2